MGRSLLSEIVPKGMSFDAVNRDMTKKAISGVINLCYRSVGLKEAVVLADQLMYTGFAYATRAGVSIGVDDMVVPQQKGRILGGAEREVKEISGAVRFGSGHQRRALQQGGRHLVAYQRPGGQGHDGQARRRRRRELQGPDGHAEVVQLDLHDGRLGRPR